MKSTTLLYVLFTLLISGCSGTHSILGSSGGYSKSDVAIQSDITVSGLKIRYSKLKTGSDCSSSGKDMVELSGPIGPDSSEVVERLLSKMTTCNGYGPYVYLNSGGGTLKDGYKLANIFRKYSASTIVGYQQSCASACAVAFLGGQTRVVFSGGKLIFHAPYLKNPSTGAAECRSKTDSEDLKKFYISMIGQKDGQFLFDRTMDTCSTTDGWTINKDAAKLFGIANSID
jgi:ATP-dependent protease ClpP protease subunit